MDSFALQWIFGGDLKNVMGLSLHAATGAGQTEARAEQTCPCFVYILIDSFVRFRVRFCVILLVGNISGAGTRHLAFYL